MIAWTFASAALLAMCLLMMYRLRRDTHSREEFLDAGAQYLVTLLASTLLSYGRVGVAPQMLLIPASAYATLLAVTRGRPTVILFRTFPDRVSPNTAVGYVAAAVLLWILVFGAVFHAFPGRSPAEPRPSSPSSPQIVRGSHAA